MNKRASWISLALLAPISVSASAADCEFTSTRAASFNGAIKKVVIVAGAGYLNIKGAASGVTAKGRACASSEALLGKIALESRREGDAVYLTVVMNENLGFGFNRYESLDLDVTVPKDALLSVEDSSGDVELSEVGPTLVKDNAGDLLLKNINGDLDVADSAGELRIVTVSGEVRVEDSSGDIDIEDVRGDVKITSDSSGDLAITNVGGGVEVVEDTSGNITISDVKNNVIIDKDTSGDINVSEVGGNFGVSSDTSGNILYDRVRGTVRIPARS